jgi:hypothetical protein
MALLKKLGSDAIHINFDTRYAGTLILGATLKAVVRRMWFALSEDRRDNVDTIPQPVYLLGSLRSLDPKLEMLENVPTILQETGATFVDGWNQGADASHFWPTSELEMMTRVSTWMGISHWTLYQIAAASETANTSTVIRTWLKEVRRPGHYLVVSSQPFCEGQLRNARQAANAVGAEGYSFDVCGPEAPPLPILRWLDNIAKQLWAEVQLLPEQVV